MTHRKPNSARPAAFSGLLLLAAGFVSLMLVNPTLSAFVTGSPAVNGSTSWSVS